MTKRIFIIHGWGARPSNHWFPWLKKELEKKGYEVTVPQMPNTEHPHVNEWVSHLSKVVGEANKDTYFVGHSLGCITIARYLESLPEKSKVGGCVFVAGFSRNIGYPELKTFYGPKIDFEKIKKYTKKFTAIMSDNDPVVPRERGLELKKQLNAKLIVEHNKGHFNAIDGVTQLPVVLEEIICMAGQLTSSILNKSGLKHQL